MDIQQHLPEDFNDNSRVWIYQSSRLFLVSEALEIEAILNGFLKSWNSHGVPVKGFANLFFGRFLVFMADESSSAVSGCSTDSSVGVVRQIQSRFNVNLLDRQALAFMVKEKIEVIPLSQFQYAVENNFITPETRYFNNTVLTKTQMIQNWIIPLKDSWLRRELPVTG